MVALFGELAAVRREARRERGEHAGRGLVNVVLDIERVHARLLERVDPVDVVEPERLLQRARDRERVTPLLRRREPLEDRGLPV